MTLNLYTARMGIRDPDFLDITRAGCDRAREAGKPAVGEFLAPSAKLVFPALRALKAAATDAEKDRVFSTYAAAYRVEMLASYEHRLDEWKALLARPRAVLICFCPDAARCHRSLAAKYLTRRGATYHGEIGKRP